MKKLEKIIYTYLSIFIFLIPPLNFCILSLITIIKLFLLNKKIINYKLVYLVLVFIFFQFAGFFYSLNLFRNLTEILAWIMVVYLIIIFDDELDQEKCLKKMELGGVISGTAIILQSFLKININDYVPFFSIPGTNNISIYILLFSFISFNQRRYVISAYFFCLILFLGSRAIIIFEFIFLISNFYKKKIFVFFSIFSLLFYFEKIFEFFKRFELNSLLNFKDNYSNLIRITIWKDCINDYLKNVYIFGVGGGNFKDYYSLIKSINFEAEHPHNFYLNILIENGLIMFIYLMLFILFIFVYILKNNFLYKKEVSFYMVNLLVYGFFESIITDTRILLTIVITLLITKNLKNKKKEEV